MIDRDEKFFHSLCQSRWHHYRWNRLKNESNIGVFFTLLELFLWSTLRSFFDPNRKRFPFPLFLTSFYQFLRPKKKKTKTSKCFFWSKNSTHCSRCWSINLNFHDFTFDKFCFFSSIVLQMKTIRFNIGLEMIDSLYSNANRSTKRLSQCFSFTHF